MQHPERARILLVSILCACFVTIGEASVAGELIPDSGLETNPDQSLRSVQQSQLGIEVPSRDARIPRGETVLSRERPELNPLGARVGTFIVYPSLELEERYDDNIFANDDGEQGDFITRVSPRLSLRSDWNNHALRFDADADVGRHLDETDEDFEDYSAAISGRVDIRRDTQVRLHAGYANRHERRSSPDDVRGTEPTEFDDLTAGAEVFQRFNRINLRLGGEFRLFDYDDVAVSGGGASINNDDRDRYIAEGYLRVAYEIVPEYEAYVRGAYNVRNYDDLSDPINGVQVDRDSEGFEIVAGVEIDFGGITFGEFFLGYISQDYEDSLLETVDGPVVGAKITWNVTPLTTIIGSATTDIRETTTTDGTGNFSSGRYFSTFSIEVDHELLRNLLLGGDVGFSRDDFQGIDRTDNIIRAGVDATYMVNRYVHLSGGYRFRLRDSDVANQDFAENIFLVGLKLQY